MGSKPLETSKPRGVLIPKNSEICSMILDCKEQNHASGVKSKEFRLLQFEKIRDRMVFDSEQSRWWLCKLDRSSCYWSIRMPSQWRHNFKVYFPGGGGYRWTR